jgi:RNA polymerase sigma factor (sigma-70 family)
LALLEEDRALLQAFREGRRDALLEVYRTYVGKVISVLSAAARGRQGTLELENEVQEVFTRAFEPAARASYDGLRPYEGFLVGIARHVAHERMRAARPVLVQAGEEAAEPLDGELERREVARLLAGFLASAAPGRKALWELRFEQGLSQDEAAARLGVTRIQLRRRERKLKLELLEYLQRHGYLAGIEVRGWSFGWRAP